MAPRRRPRRSGIRDHPGHPAWPTVDGVTGDFADATPVLRAVLRQAAAVTEPVLTLLASSRVLLAPADLRVQLLLPAVTALQPAQRGTHFAELARAADAAAQHAGWREWAVDRGHASDALLTLETALLGAAITDLVPALALELLAPWNDAMPPDHLDTAAIRLWCQLRRGGATRQQALPILPSVLQPAEHEASTGALGK